MITSERRNRRKVKRREAKLGGEKEGERYVWDEEVGEKRVWTNISCKNK